MNLFHFIGKYIKNVFEFIAHIIFPLSKNERVLLRMSPSKLRGDFPNTWSSNDNKSFALFPYKNEFIKEIIWLFKYRENKRALDIFSKLLGELIIEICSEKIPFSSGKRIVLILIPTHKNSFHKKDFDSNLLLARKIINDYGEDFFEIKNNLLQFKKEVKKQTSCKNKKEREENMNMAFTISNNENLSGRIVAIIDDVTTTGATFKEARRALNSLGAASPKEIYCFALAH